MTDTTTQAVTALVRKLQSQIGDDVQEAYSHDALFRLSAASLAALAAERDALAAQVEELTYPTWPQWAAETLATLRDFGWRFDDDTIDLPGAVADWLREYPDSATAGLVEQRDEAIAERDALAAQLAEADAFIEAQTKDHASNNVRYAEMAHKVKVAQAAQLAAEAKLAELELSHTIDKALIDGMHHRNLNLVSELQNATDEANACGEERDALAAALAAAEHRVFEPCEPGGFVGDIYYGHPVKTTMGTHRWDGKEWHKLPSEIEPLMALLAESRAQLAAAQAAQLAAEAELATARVDALEEAARMIEQTAYTSNGGGRSLEPVSAGLAGMDMHHATIAAAIRALAKEGS